MTHGQRSFSSLLLGLFALGAGALAQNFLVSRPFLSDGIFLFGVGVALLIIAFPKGGLVPGAAEPILKRLMLAGQTKAISYVLFGVVMTLYALTTLKGNLMPAYGWFAFLGGILLLMLGVRAWDTNRGLVSEPNRTSRWELIAIVVITLVAAYLRFSNLNTLPFGVWYDESVGGLEAVALATSKAFPVYYEAESGHAVLSIYIIAFFFKLLGVSAFSLRLTAAIVGVLAVPVFYKMIRQFFGVHAALVGAFLLAISRWHFNFSRIAFDDVFVVLFSCVCIYFLAKGFRTKKVTDFAFGGLALAAGLNTYAAFRLFPAVVVLFLLHKLVFERRSFRAALPGLVVFGLAAFLAAAPLLKYAYDNQKAFNARSTTASVFTGRAPEQARKMIDTNIQKHLLMFNVRGDGNGRHNLPGEPMLDPLSGALFVLGAGFSLWNWRRSSHFVFIATFGVMILAGILSLDFEAPQSHRSIGVIPAVFAFASLPLGLAWQAMDRFREAAPRLWQGRGGLSFADPLERTAAWALNGRPMWVALGAVAILATLAWAGTVNHFNYFTRQAAAFASWNAFSTAETLIAYRLRQLRAEDNDVFVTPLYAGGLPTIRFLAPNAPPYRVFDPANGIPLRTQKKEVVIFVEPGYSATYQQLKRFYPGSSFEEITNKPHGGPPGLYIARITREEVARIQGLNAALYPGEAKEGQPKVAPKADSLDFDWGKETKIEPPFVGEWQGTIFAPQYGSYQFSIEGTAKAELYLDESPLLDTEETPKNQVTLAKGNHAIRLVAAIVQGDEKLQVKWQIPGGQMTVVNRDYLYVPPVTNNGLLGKYYRSPNWQGSPAYTQIDPSVSFYFHLIPLPRPYSVEWTGKLFAPVAGRYVLGTESISASQLFIDGRMIVDNKVLNQLLEAPVNLDVGLHDITVRFQDRDNFSHVYLYWTMPGKAREQVRSEYLFPPQGSYPPPEAIPTPVPLQSPPVATPAPVTTSGTGPAPDAGSKRVQAALEIGRKGSGDGEFTEPRDIAVDKDGNVYVVDTGNARVQKFGPDGKFLAKWGKRGNGDGEFQEPLAIVVDSQNQLLVLDSATGWIQRFDTGGKFKGRLAGPQAQLFHPRGMNIDAKDNLYIADTGGCRIVVYKTSGDYVGAFGSKGSGDGQMLEPADAVTLADGSILVSDVANKRIQKFDSGWKYVGQWRVPEASAFNGGHLAVSPDGFVHATQPELHRVAKYDLGMKLLGAIGEIGEGSGQLRLPVGLFVDGAGNLFVADTYNHRVQKFGPAS